MKKQAPCWDAVLAMHVINRGLESIIYRELNINWKKILERTKHQLTPSKIIQETKNTETFLMLIDYKHNNLKHNKHYNL